MSDFLRVLYEVSRSFSELTELDELVPTVIAKTRELLRADGCAVLLLNEERTALYFPYTVETCADVDQRLAQVHVPLDRGIASWVVRHGVSQLVADATQDERWYADADRQTGVETRSLLTSPLRTRHGIIGVIQARSAQAQAFGEDDLAFMDAMAQGVAIAIENAQLYGRLRASERDLRQQVAVLHREVARTSRYADIVGASEAMQRVFRLVDGAITAPVTVLLCGETGTGKDLIARTIHFNGPRAAKPFVAMNCAALSEHLLESELFGHRRGAFTGALEDRKGLFEVADGGTVFLDEVGEMPAAMQAKLLRVLENREVLPVGENSPRRIDVRVIAATNSDVQASVEQGRFRRDLYYRLNAFPILVPPLRERADDIPLLAARALAEIGARFAKRIAGVSPAALAALTGYGWPGNVRELQNELERAVVLTPQDAFITPAELSPHLASAGGAAPPEAQGTAAQGESSARSAFSSLRDARAAFEAQYIASVLQAHDGKVAAAARVLGLTRSALYEKMKAYQLRDG